MPNTPTTEGQTMITASITSFRKLVRPAGKHDNGAIMPALREMAAAQKAGGVVAVIDPTGNVTAAMIAEAGLNDNTIIATPGTADEAEAISAKLHAGKTCDVIVVIARE